MVDLSDRILYEDDDCLVINKPAGLVVHADGRTEEPTVADWVLKTYPETREVGEPIKLSDGREMLRPGIVHRIDRETSGALIIAKTEKGFESLKSQFQHHEVEKVYHLFVYGTLADKRGSINLPIGRSAGDFRKRSAQRGKKGELREALTYFEVLGHFPEKGVTFVEAKPKTGRTHQIRVHFQALQRPVVADSLYAVSKPKLLGFERLALHARRVTFLNTQGERIMVQAPYPVDFRKALDSLGVGVLD